MHFSCSLRYDVEIEVEEERKFLPTDLFAEGAAGAVAPTDVSVDVDEALLGK